MRQAMKERTLLGVLPLLLFAVVAISILTVIMTGAKLYKNITVRDSEAFSFRVTAQYFETKIRQAHSPECVRVEKSEVGDVIVISEDISGLCFETRIYTYNGRLTELYSVSGGEFDPNSGETVVELDSFSAELASGLIAVELRYGETSRDIFIDLSEEAAK